MDKAAQDKIVIDIKSLTMLAVFLSGFHQGKGNILPLGTCDLENLWHTIKYLQGDVRYMLDSNH